MPGIIGIVSIFLATAMLTGVFRHYALKKGMMDVPNNRSSHVVATPRGGGIAVVIVFLSVLFFYLTDNAINIDSRYIASLFLGGATIAAVGFWDDHQHVPASWRSAIHLVAAFASLLVIPSLPVINLFGYNLNLGWLAYPVYAIAIVWLLNLYNFMDGIDGIASVQAISVSGGAALILLLQGQQTWAALLFLLSICVAGFLVWNWPPAKVFMGDACSGFLGFILGLLLVITSAEGSINLWSWIILLGVFWLDATVTLVRRIFRGEKFYEAHRSHAYQRLSRRWQSHKKVTLSVLAINTLWLLPWALAATFVPTYSLLIFFVALTPLAYLILMLGAGKGDLEA